MVQVTGKSLSSLTSVSFPLPGGNLSQFDFSHTAKQITNEQLKILLFTVDGSAARLLPRQAGPPTLASPDLV